MKIVFVCALVALASFPRFVLADDVRTLVGTLKATAKAGKGISKGETQLVEKLQAIGAPAIPYLLPLLRDEDQEVRELASCTLRDIEGLTEANLDALIESCRRGEGWVPPAIARIGTPRAVTFLVEELVRQRETHNQLTYSMEILGEKAVPKLVEVYRAEEGWDDKLERTMSFVFRDLGHKAIAAIDPLMRIAEDETASPEKRIRAIVAVGSIGSAAERVVPNLQKIRDHGNDGIQIAATAAILDIGPAEAVPILLDRLKEAHKPSERGYVLRDIAELRARGGAAGPEVVKCLRDEDWDVRVAAAQTIGMIGYKNGADALIAVLDTDDDWRLVFNAAEALGRLEMERAVPALMQISKVHWYPPVRDAALTAIRAISDNVTAEKDDAEPTHFRFDDYPGAEDMKDLEPDEAKSIRFPIAATPIVSVTVALKREGNPIQAEEWPGLKVDGGYLAGSDRGEWGGEIVFVDVEGNPHVIAEENTEAIYKTSDHIIAVTGLAHMTLNSGFVFRIEKGGDRWKAEKWRALPGAPRFSRLLEDGRLFVSCYGGIVLISPDGTMTSLTRTEALRP